MANKQQEVAPETLEQKFTRLLADGTSWIGVFQNQDLGHSRIGECIAFAFDTSQLEAAKIGSTRAPDHANYGLGWRYILIAKCATVDEAVFAFNHGTEA